MMKANPMTLMSFVLVLAALYMLMLHKPKPEPKVKSVRFVEKEDIVRENPAPAHMQADPNERIW